MVRTYTVLLVTCVAVACKAASVKNVNDGVVSIGRELKEQIVEKWPVDLDTEIALSFIDAQRQNAPKGSFFSLISRQTENCKTDCDDGNYMKESCSMDCRAYYREMRIEKLEAQNTVLIIIVVITIVIMLIGLLATCFYFHKKTVDIKHNLQEMKHNLQEEMKHQRHHHHHPAGDGENVALIHNRVEPQEEDLVI